VDNKSSKAQDDLEKDIMSVFIAAMFHGDWLNVHIFPFRILALNPDVYLSCMYLYGYDQLVLQ
jgi:hypothetical protein